MLAVDYIFDQLRNLYTWITFTEEDQIILKIYIYICMYRNTEQLIDFSGTYSLTLCLQLLTRYKRSRLVIKLKLS